MAAVTRSWAWRSQGALVITVVGITLCVGAALMAQRPSGSDPAAAAKVALAKLDGTSTIAGLRDSVEVRRDNWGVPHIYAKNTADLFFAQGFVVAQDRMWQLEMWRRNGEGKLAEVLGKEYVRRDTFARTLQFRGNWDEEFKRYHPEGRLIFESFAHGVNAAIQQALDTNKVPVEFQLMGFRPQPVWTAKTVLNRMPSWTLARNLSSEVSRAMDIKAMGIKKTEELRPTTPKKTLEVPVGLNLDDIDPAILDITRGANDFRWRVPGAPASTSASAGRVDDLISPDVADLGSNNWVIGPSKSVTGGPILANDPHREVVNPALRYVVHLNAPGWNAIGATEPGLPGITIGHNDHLAWGFTILVMDQQDLYVEETDPADPNNYLYKGEWLDMRVEREVIYVSGQAQPVEVDIKSTRHGPVLYENSKRQRAYALKWIGSEVGGAGYLGSLNVMQTKNWKEFNDALPAAWYIPAHSLVYADVEGNFGYIGPGWTPVRRNWDGLLPVPGKDGLYEWDGHVPFDKLPRSLNDKRGFYNSSNNDVVPKIVPGFTIPLGYEYTAPFRYDRVFEVLSEQRKFSVADMAALQQDTLSIPARLLVPLLKTVTTSDADARQAIDMLLKWNYVASTDSVAATVYEFWAPKVAARAYAPRVPEAVRETFQQFDLAQAIEWMLKPDAAYGPSARERTEARNTILVAALTDALADIRKRVGDDQGTWQWGKVHTADFVHPLKAAKGSGELFNVAPVPRGGDNTTVQVSSGVSATNTKQNSGASFMFVTDVKDWDRSVALNTPGNSAQPLSPHYSDLAPLWGSGSHFPMAFSREKVESVTKNRLMLQPIKNQTSGSADASDPTFTLMQADLFSKAGAIASAWADFDSDGDLDVFVGSRRGELSRLYRNDAGTFADVAAELGITDSEDGRAAAWGDFDGDGDLDLYAAFLRGAVPNRLYRNDGNGKRFTDVARNAGVGVAVNVRQVSWVDYDKDGDLDLFLAIRDRGNILYRNDSGKFTDVAPALGVADSRKTVGAAWLDFDQDGDLDLFSGNQDGDTNGLYRNDGDKFVDVASQMGVAELGREPTTGTVSVAVADYDNDGDLDIFTANYGPNSLFRNDSGTKFVDVASELGIAGDTHTVGAAWGDFDNDGWLDLYTTSYLSGILQYPDFLWHNEAGQRFSDVIPSIMLKHDGDHSVQWADYDNDGDLDIILASEHMRGGAAMFRNNRGGPEAKKSLQVLVLDDKGRYTRAGTEVRLFASGTSQLLGSRIVDTASGYNSQNAAPVHFGLRSASRVDIQISAMTVGKRVVQKIENVDPSAYAGKWFVVRVSASGQLATGDGRTSAGQ